MEWLTKAAHQGQAVAQHEVGIMRSRGHGVPKKSLSIAFEWHLKAAKQGYAQAQCSVGVM